MIDERMIADAVKWFRERPINEKVKIVGGNTAVFVRNMDEIDGCFQDAAFYARLLSQQYNVLAHEIEAMCADTTENEPPTKDGDK